MKPGKCPTPLLFNLPAFCACVSFGQSCRSSRAEHERRLQSCLTLFNIKKDFGRTVAQYKAYINEAFHSNPVQSSPGAVKYHHHKVAATAASASLGGIALHHIAIVMEDEYDEQLQEKYKNEIASLLAPPTPHAIQQYYDKLQRAGHAPGLKVKLTSDMGKGVFSEKDFKEEEVVLQEQMLVGSQHFSNKADAFVCSFCFRYLGSIEYQIGRRLFLHKDGKHSMLKGCDMEDSCSSQSKQNFQSHVSEELLESLLGGQTRLPHTEKFLLPNVVNCIGGCDEDFYCSMTCAEAAWERFHGLLCTGENSICRKRAELLNFKQHADETNDIFHVAAQVIASVILKCKRLRANSSNDIYWQNVLEQWEPFAMGYKKLWWDCVALPDDVDAADEPEFRKEVKDLAWLSLQLLKEAIFEEEYAPLFSLNVYGNIVGMFELNNLDLVVASPVEDYFLYIDELPEHEKTEAEMMTKPLLDALGDDYATCCQGTAFFCFQSCVNHSCDPNCRAFKREQDKDGRAVIISSRAITMDEQIFISYINEDLPWSDRQSLLSDYGIHCKCQKCLKEKSVICE